MQPMRPARLKLKAFPMGEEPERQLELEGFGPPTFSSTPPGLVLEPLHPLQSLKVLVEDLTGNTKLLPEGYGCAVITPCNYSPVITA